MLRLLVLAALVLCGYCHEDNIQYLEENENGRVVGGSNAAKNAWPWQVSLQYLSGNSWYHTCGASLIRANRVLTAAHCVDRVVTFRVALGDHILSANDGTEQYISVSSIRKHASWNTNNVAAGNDIAILWLAYSATLNNAVKLATLPASGTILAHNYACVVTGWGRLSTNGALASTLQQATLPVVAHSTCSSSSWWGSTVKSTMICAGGDGIRSSCNVSWRVILVDPSTVLSVVCTKSMVLSALDPLLDATTTRNHPCLPESLLSLPGSAATSKCITPFSCGRILQTTTATTNNIHILLNKNNKLLIKNLSPANTL